MGGLEVSYFANKETETWSVQMTCYGHTSAVHGSLGWNPGGLIPQRVLLTFTKGNAPLTCS